MGKCSNPGGKGGFRKHNADVTNAIRKLIYRANFILVGQWRSVQIREEGMGIQGGGILRKKMHMSQMPFQNESVEQVSSKSDNGKVFKIRGKCLEGRNFKPNFIRIGQWESVQNQGKRLGGRDGIHGREEFRKKKYKRHK